MQAVLALLNRGVWCLAAIAIVTVAAPGRADDASLRVPLRPDSIQHEKGSCYTAHMDFGEEGDKLSGGKSMLVVFEQGKPLGPARSVHADIRAKGGGRYSHWSRDVLYFSASDNTDPRTNGRTYEVGTTSAHSTLGGLSRLPSSPKSHVEEIRSNRHEYQVAMAGTLDAENTRTLESSNSVIAFQPNLSLTIENAGDTPVVNPRLVLNGRGDWYTFDSLLAEFTRGATSDQEKAWFIWQNMRENLYHERPLYGNPEPHDPVRLLNIFGFNLCDDAGNAGCSLFYHAGLIGSQNRSLHGHVQCEAMVEGRLEFLDIDMDCFYLDRENERPVSGDECARDHDLVRRELNYGPVVPTFQSSDGPAALFGADDRHSEPHLRGHQIAYTLRPGEKAVFRWDNAGKLCAESAAWVHRPKYFGNSKFIYRPRLDMESVKAEASSAVDLVETTAAGPSRKLAGRSADAHLAYEIRVPYIVCGGTLRADFLGEKPDDTFSVDLSLDGKKWSTLWTARGTGEHRAEVALDESLDVLRAPAKYGYFARVGLGSAGAGQGAGLASLEIETDVMAAPASLPRLRLGTNRAVYQDASQGPHHVRITHQWRECDAVKPLAPPAAPLYPSPGATIADSIVTFSWPAVVGARQYHLQVSRRADFRIPYRPCLDVIIPATTWRVPYTGIFSPDTTYYGRLRSRDAWGVWGPWSEPWSFRWRGPRTPVNVRIDRAGETFVLRWEPNPRGEQPARYDVYGSDEKGFSEHKGPHHVPGRGDVPGNFLGRTDQTSLVVVSPDMSEANANKSFFRVVAIDARGTESGCSDYAELLHPLIYSRPVTLASVGHPYRYQVRSLRSLGDWQCRQTEEAGEKQNDYRFWDTEDNRFALRKAPSWLTIDPSSGVVTGTPGERDRGRAAVMVQVGNQFGGQAEQEFEIHVESP